ncbi:serine/threonine-protein kinase/endoribonuclease IRE1-like [Onychostoma macrolepis]|uniref:serine/threonine-protein kinase/endoribonuclease IRE1-like n=1 Tax=Onychostoma macrolepis TaxID=369639 RepID=UPI00272AD897|nr:serine/threonine-protein kinase/endoribonuclease IRE1-like [Onychostoma macrolepis]XP_058623729.1 serine/threonine-protein kinase/endoribonuclease IRE1-like [Onychostoma macrolepis]XP_058623730.1 serine/threonine-protein kinase/endoribonuclease IRE1-like [Onychostoma macrolepis]XP_058623731.1 serine/threonine-protein kinase/endoribonuclease IRE1-like [Onychostoma macrolepis]XP_058623732.1 serine/threonine-protein kinase/endoribonuclease IRE1-like [Onychostoma macrolepis]
MASGEQDCDTAQTSSTGVSVNVNAGTGGTLNVPVFAGNTFTAPLTISYSTAGHEPQKISETAEKHTEKQGSSSQADHQKPVPDDIIRWNRSSVKYRSKIEALRKDPSRKKVGNIHFSKSNNYQIGSGGSSTVYLGLKEDGTEVAIKRIIKDQQETKHFENELKLLQDSSLESKNIVKYVDLAEDEDFYYLALQLCEYDLEDYMKILRQKQQKDKDTALRKIVEEILHGLQVLHRAEVMHRDIKPGNVLMDSGENARLADFGLSRTLKDGRSTLHTARAGTRGWEATEILNQHTGYKKSSDIQVAGMLVFYILSDGKHPFGDVKDREENIKTGQYVLQDLQDTVAEDLVAWMINKEPAERLTIDEVLGHPYFWDDDRQDAVLRKLGDRPEIQKYETLAKFHDLYMKDKEHTEGREPTATLTIYEAFDVLKIENEKKRKDIIAIVGEDLNDLWKLFNTAEDVTKGKSFFDWQSKLSGIWPDVNNKLLGDVLGLLRFLRNKLVHTEDFKEKKIFVLFPDFFISIHRVAKDLNWEY